MPAFPCKPSLALPSQNSKRRIATKMGRDQGTLSTKKLSQNSWRRAEKCRQFPRFSGVGGLKSTLRPGFEIVSKSTQSSGGVACLGVERALACGGAARRRAQGNPPKSPRVTEKTTSGVAIWPSSTPVFLDICCRDSDPRPLFQSRAGRVGTDSGAIGPLLFYSAAPRIGTCRVLGGHGSLEIGLTGIRRAWRPRLPGDFNGQGVLPHDLANYATARPPAPRRSRSGGRGWTSTSAAACPSPRA